MKKIIILLFVIIFYSCSEKSIFTDFDSVQYYSIDENYNSQFLNRLVEKSDLNYIKILEDDFPNKLNDSLFYTELNSEKFISNKISKSDIKEFLNNSTFTSEYTTACIPKYRDILILKKSNKVIGIIKICLECQMYYLIGKDKESKDIVNSGGIEISELEIIFKNIKLNNPNPSNNQ